MKRTRKGFTLVELLIVVAIMGTLAAAMTASVTGATAKAKAATIASNVSAMEAAARNYYANNMEDASKIAVATTAVLDDSLPTWRGLNQTDAKITYTPDTTVATTANYASTWAVTVNFNSDADAANIKTELAKIKRFGSYKDNDTDTADVDHLDGNKFKVILYTGVIQKANS